MPRLTSPPTILSAAGFSLIELALVAGLMATATAVATPLMLTALDDFKTLGAVRHISGLLQQARMQAALRHADVGMRFTLSGSLYTYAVYVDGNGNGVRSRDISNGVDREIRRPERLTDQFSGIDFGTLPGLPAVDASSSPPGTDPIRLGSSNLAVFTNAGTSTSGSLYIRGRRNVQYVIRVFGETGKTRILRLDPGTRQWKPL
jgi:type II secretory pathway pseudopilin PulG